MDSVRKKIAELGEFPSVPFRGGAVTVRERALIPFGGYSTMLNMRNWHPGLEMRRGQDVLHDDPLNYAPENLVDGDQKSGYFDNTDTTWALARDAATADNFTVADEGDLKAEEDGGGNYIVNRIPVIFDLSSFPSGTITAAKLFFYTSGGDSSVSAQEGTFGTSPAAADFDSFTGSTFGTVDISSATDEFKSISFNAAGITYLQGVLGSTAKIMLREYEHDYLNSAPASSTSFDNNVHLFGSGVSTSPFLVLTFSGPGGTEGVGIISLYQFSKGKQDEKHFYAQSEDGYVYEAINQPPATSSNIFGSPVFLSDNPSAQIPAAWSNLKDFMLYSNGADQHQIFPGNNQPVNGFIYVNDTAAIKKYPDKGFDYTLEVIDENLTTAAIFPIAMLPESSNYDAIFIKTRVPAKNLNFVFKTFNGTGSVLQAEYWDGDTFTGSGDFVDGTASGGTAFAQDGSIERTTFPNSNEKPHYMFNQTGFWYKLTLTSGSIDTGCEIAEVTYDSDWQEVRNVWNGIPIDAVEAQIYDISEDVYQTYAASAVVLAEHVSADEIYIACGQQAIGLYVGVGATPNTIASTVLTVEYWDGTQFTTVSNLDDGTSGFAESGWISWDPPADEFKQQFRDTKYHAYWYRITTSGNLSDDPDLVFSWQYQPNTSIEEFGRVGNVNAAWKNRACYTFEKFPRDVYVTQAGEPFYLNGTDFTILEPGDGRLNRTVAAKNFYNELMVWQEERGRNGGCVTIFEGYNPATFGKLVLSTKIGTFSQKSAVVVDGAQSSTRTTQTVQTTAYFLSHYGIFLCDGRLITSISDDIQNYFDPRFPECIRRGFENEMWVEHDSGNNVLKFGLVSGATATKCNVFPVYDLIDQTWSFDTPSQSLSCMHETESDSGQFHVLQVGGGSSDGYVYQLNIGSNDVDDGINARVIMELNQEGYHLELNELIIRMKTQTSGDATLNVYEDGVFVSDHTRILSMTEEETGQIFRRHRELFDANQRSLLSVEIYNEEIDESIYLQDIGFEISKVRER